MVDATAQKAMRMGIEVKRAKKRVSHSPPPTDLAMNHGTKRRMPMKT